MVAGRGQQCLILRRAVRRLDRDGVLDRGRFEFRDQIRRLKGTPKRLEGGIARIRGHLHPGRLIGSVVPKVLMGIDNKTHRMAPKKEQFPSTGIKWGSPVSRIGASRRKNVATKISGIMSTRSGATKSWIPYLLWRPRPWRLSSRRLPDPFPRPGPHRPSTVSDRSRRHEASSPVHSFPSPHSPPSLRERARPQYSGPK